MANRFTEFFNGNWFKTIKGVENNTTVINDRFSARDYLLNAYERFSGSTHVTPLKENNAIELSYKITAINIAVDRIGQALNSGVIYVEDSNGKKLDNDPLSSILNNPNEFQTREEFYKQFARFYYAGGYCFVLPQEIAKQTITDSYGFSSQEKTYRTIAAKYLNDKTEFWLLNPDDVSTDFSNEVLKGNKVAKVHYSTALFNGSTEYKFLIPFYDNSDPENPIKGKSRLWAVAKDIEHIQRADDIIKWFQSLFGNIIVSPKRPENNANGFSGKNLTDPINSVNGHVTHKDVIEDKLNSNVRNILVSEVGLDAVNLMQSINEQDLSKDKRESEEKIFDLFQIPHAYRSQAKYDNYSNEIKEWYDSVIVPLSANIARSFESFYGYDKQRKKVKFDFSQMSFYKKQKHDDEKSEIEKKKIELEYQSMQLLELRTMLANGEISQSQFNNIQNGIYKDWENDQK
ncbi:phage portal protein [Chryseobacterium sp. 7]|uniref:phage portal protein n=1 Tax=Chryseobacterium sp. 7 TaxID=2035214 RepID=UPI0016008F63|nr:phage portal protein [Chryseobacterium sp. 7]